MPEIIDRSGRAYSLSADIIELPPEMEYRSVKKHYAVEIWTTPPVNKEAAFVAVEYFDEYPSEDQIFWCFCKHRGGAVARVKEEYYLIDD